MYLCTTKEIHCILNLSFCSIQFPKMKKFYNTYRKGCYLFLSIAILINIPSFLPKNNPEKEAVTITAAKSLTLLQKQELFLQMAKRLDADGLLSISPQRFAKICMVTSWCESNLRTDAKNGDMEGIWQWTADTRKRRKFPKTILNKDFATQVGYCEIYLRSISNKIKFIKTSEDLHIIKFSPSRIHLTVFSETANNPKLIPLDKNKDGQITRIDFTLQQMQRVKENKVIRQMFEEVRSKTKV